MEIQRTGRWLYGDTTYLPVDIISLDSDFWYEMAKVEDQLEPDEEPQPMNSEGVLYYYRFRRAGESTATTWVDSGGFAAIEDAMNAAQDRAPSPIQWD